ADPAGGVREAQCGRGRNGDPWGLDRRDAGRDHPVPVDPLARVRALLRGAVGQRRCQRSAPVAAGRTDQVRGADYAARSPAHDGRRIFQSIVWKYTNYRRGTLAAIYAGFIVMFVVALYGVIGKDPLFLCLAIFIYVSCKQEWIVLETGGEESLFGYDFSQGYT